MRNLFILLCIVFLASSCGDGDIITVELDFDQTLERCDNDTASYLIFDTREDPSESLSLIIPRNAENELLFINPTPTDNPEVLNINGSTIRFNYRTYNRTITSNDLCNVIPPADLTIIEDFEAPAGIVEITSTIIDDDNDGIPSALEGADPNGDGDFSDSLDSDGDGIFDYIDQDDDNDNVDTSRELDNTDGDDDPTTNPLDTDGDGIPDYLDEDDDGDGVPTRLEDENGDGQLINDTANNAEGELVPHYLNVLETISYPFPGFNNNTYTRTVNTSFIIRDIDIEIIRATVIDMGVFTNSFSITQEN